MDWNVVVPPIGAAAIPGVFAWWLWRQKRRSNKRDESVTSGVTERATLLLNWNTLVESQQKQIQALQSKSIEDGNRISDLEKSNADCERRANRCDQRVERLMRRLTQLETRARKQPKEPNL
jgi:hypothetical protein